MDESLKCAGCGAAAEPLGVTNGDGACPHCGSASQQPALEPAGTVAP